MSLDRIICQNQLYASRFKELGFKESAITVSGNLKLDVESCYDIEDHLERSWINFSIKEK